MLLIIDMKNVSGNQPPYNSIIWLAKIPSIVWFFFLLGFYVRKYIYNYHSRKRYLQGIVAKNEIVRWD